MSEFWDSICAHQMTYWYSARMRDASVLRKNRGWGRKSNAWARPNGLWARRQWLATIGLWHCLWVIDCELYQFPEEAKASHVSIRNIVLRTLFEAAQGSGLETKSRLQFVFIELACGDFHDIIYYCYSTFLVATVQSARWWTTIYRSPGADTISIAFVIRRLLMPVNKAAVMFQGHVWGVLDFFLQLDWVEGALGSGSDRSEY